MLQSQIGKYIRHPELLNDDTLFELHEIVARYPFFQSAKLLLLKNLFILHDGSFGKELVKNAIYITDRSVLYDMVEKTGQNNCFDQRDHGFDSFDKLRTGSFDQFRNQTANHEGESDRTLSLIDDFLQSESLELRAESLERTGELVPEPVEGANPSTDYLLYMEGGPHPYPEHSPALPLQGEPGGSPERTLTLIDQFLSQSDEMPLIRFDNIPSTSSGQVPSAGSPIKADEPTNDNNDGNDEGDTIYTENLAKIFIKQKRYSQALKIIKQIYLQNPQKNCYFADQIRFLEKLIINEKNKS